MLIWSNVNDISNSNFLFCNYNCSNFWISKDVSCLLLSFDNLSRNYMSFWLFGLFGLNIAFKIIIIWILLCKRFCNDLCSIEVIIIFLFKDQSDRYNKNEHRNPNQLARAHWHFDQLGWVTDWSVRASSNPVHISVGNGNKNGKSFTPKTSCPCINLHHVLTMHSGISISLFGNRQLSLRECQYCPGPQYLLSYCWSQHCTDLDYLLEVNLGFICIWIWHFWKKQMAVFKVHYSFYLAFSLLWLFCLFTRLFKFDSQQWIFRWTE